MGVISTNSHVCEHKLCSLLCTLAGTQIPGENNCGQRGKRMKNRVRNDASSGNLKGKPMTTTIWLHWLQQVTKHVPATNEASVHRAQLRVKTLSYCFCYCRQPVDNTIIYIVVMAFFSPIHHSQRFGLAARTFGLENLPFSKSPL